MQCRKSIKIIQSCKDCPCHHHIGYGNPPKTMCQHIEIWPNNAKRYLMNLKDRVFHTSDGKDWTRLRREFSDSDKKEIEIDGFPHWCPLERSK